MIDINTLVRNKLQDLRLKVLKEDPKASIEYKDSMIKMVANDPFRQPLIDIDINTKGKQYNFNLMFNQQTQKLEAVPIL